ncbi:hypothetical protein BpHYR1_038328 [Brachionus plicatilis]|uniref:Uncharacterized protein n=1 Tax=Brachionus plicatilis TaxID=10195 RepID=A0A3M7SH72_BRAPC|nr:hypothetical protein BpHYR1_038328 [Brachionus plicatilis]
MHHNSAVSRSQAQDEKRGGWWQPHNVVFYESEEELYYGQCGKNYIRENFLNFKRKITSRYKKLTI